VGFGSLGWFAGLAAEAADGWNQGNGMAVIAAGGNSWGMGWAWQISMHFL
jgi:hypothetical protein